MRRSRSKTTRYERISSSPSLMASAGDRLPERGDDLLDRARSEGEAAYDHDEQREDQAAVDVALDEDRDRHEPRDAEQQRRRPGPDFVAEIAAHVARGGEGRCGAGQQ